MRNRSRPSRRHGMSLMEVLIALAIFLGAMIVLGRLVILGGETATKVQELARGTELCQSKLAEVVAGVVPLSSQSGSAFDEDPVWTWSLDCSQGDIANLWDVTVKVKREHSDGAAIECSLSQKVLDPSVRGNAMDAVLTAPAPASTSSNTPTSSSSSTPSGTSSAPSGPSAATSKGPATTPAKSAAPTTPKTGAGSGTSKGGG